MNFYKKPITFVSQVNLKIMDMERSLKFYQEIIGFKLLEKTERSAKKLTVDGSTVLLTIHQPENVTPKQGRTTGLYHFAILLPNRSDLHKHEQISIPPGSHMASKLPKPRISP